MKDWDVFISHASEDKEAVALPLAQFLSNAGLEVWLDAHELHLGDSIREKIDQGLARSRFGVVILSKAFFEKRWPARELSALFALEEGAHHVILPIWHEVDQPTVASFSPMIADRLATDTKKGLTGVARDIIARVASAEGGDTTALRKFNRLFEGSSPQKEAIRDFLILHPEIVQYAVRGQLIHVSPTFGDHHLDFVTTKLGSTLKEDRWIVVQLSTLKTPLFDKNLRLADEVNSTLEELKAIVAELRANSPQLTWPGDPIIGIDGTLVAGRRDELRKERVALQSLVDSLDGIQVRSYDWLIQAAAEYYRPSAMKFSSWPGIPPNFKLDLLLKST